MKKCPFCAEEILEEAVRCKHCHADLAPPSPWAPLLWRLGTVVVVLALVGLVRFMTMDVSVEVPVTTIPGVPGLGIPDRDIGGGRVNNIGLMQDRQNGLTFSGIGLLVGGVLLFLGRRREPGTVIRPMQSIVRMAGGTPPDKGSAAGNTPSAFAGWQVDLAGRMSPVARQYVLIGAAAVTAVAVLMVIGSMVNR